MELLHRVPTVVNMMYGVQAEVAVHPVHLCKFMSAHMYIGTIVAEEGHLLGATVGL